MTAAGSWERAHAGHVPLYPHRVRSCGGSLSGTPPPLRGPLPSSASADNDSYLIRYEGGMVELIIAPLAVSDPSAVHLPPACDHYQRCSTRPGASPRYRSCSSSASGSRQSSHPVLLLPSRAKRPPVPPWVRWYARGARPTYLGRISLRCVIPLMACPERAVGTTHLCNACNVRLIELTCISNMFRRSSMFPPSDVHHIFW